MAKVKVEVEIPDGEHCNPDGSAPFCPFWWESEDGNIGCSLLRTNREREYEEDTFLCIKFPGCPNPG